MSLWIEGGMEWRKKGRVRGTHMEGKKIMTTS
jgi:hypothetical protein